MNSMPFYVSMFTFELKKWFMASNVSKHFSKTYTMKLLVSVNFFSYMDIQGMVEDTMNVKE